MADNKKTNLNEIQVRNIIENWAKAVRAKDMDGALAHHTKEVVMFDVPPPLQSKGFAAYKKTWELFFQYSSGGKGSFDLRELEITVSDTVAFCHALLIIGGEKKPTCRLTIGLKKLRGEWLIAHEHHSYPYEG